MNETQATPSRVHVAFKRSSTKDGGEGYEIDVFEDADQAEVDRVMEMAIRLREKALAALAPKQLEEAFK